MKFLPSLKLGLIMVLVSPVLACAQGTQRVDTGLSGGGAADLLNESKAPDQVTPAETSPVKMTLTCTDRSGKTIKEGEKGYAECMRNHKLKGDFRGPIPNTQPKR